MPTDLAPIARIHLFSLTGHNPHTAYLTERGGVQIRLDLEDIVVKGVTSVTVTAAGGPLPFLKSVYPDAEIELPPFVESWTLPVAVVDEDADVLINE